MFKSSNFLSHKLRPSNLAIVPHIHLLMAAKPLQLIKATKPPQLIKHHLHYTNIMILSSVAFQSSINKYLANLVSHSSYSREISFSQNTLKWRHVFYIYGICLQEEKVVIVELGESHQVFFVSFFVTLVFELYFHIFYTFSLAYNNSPLSFFILPKHQNPGHSDLAMTVLSILNTVKFCPLF